MKNDPGWAISATADIGKRVAAFRERRGMTVQALADRCAGLGLPLGRVALTKLETGKRQGVTPAELMVFAAVFEVAPIELIFPIGYAGRVELFPGAELRPLDAVNWFCGGVALDVSLDGARVRIQYLRDGKAVEEQLLSVVDCLESQFGAMFAQPAYARRVCQSRSIIITRVPQGHLDELLASPQFLAFNKSIQGNHDWDTRLAHDQMAAFQKSQAANNAQFQANMQKSRDDNARLLANGKAFQDNMRASTDAAMANDRARQNAIDASAHATALYSLDRQEFKNPSTGQTIEASSQYSHQWMSSDGSTLIQTNDHSYDPNGQVYPVSQSWTELNPK